MKSAILEINNNKKVNGRTYLKWVVLEIHDNNSLFNKNGITWLEKYIKANLDSIQGMPLCVEFIDYENSEPFGHGLTEIKDGTPLFENSAVVGVTTNGYIDSIEVNGKQKRVLIGEGYIYNQRYPKFVQWLKSKMFDGDFPETSVEISAVEGKTNIEYEGGYKEEGRVPMIFDFTGDAILGIDPADDTAVLLELNSKNKEDKILSKEKEALVELNEKFKVDIESLEAKVSELNELLTKKTNELNAAVQAVKDEKAKNEAKDEEVKKAKEDKEKADAELNSLKEFKKSVTEETLKTELNHHLSRYTEEEKSVAKEKIELFSTSPTEELKIQIVSEINSAIAQSYISQRMNQTSVETNSAKDIYSEINEIGNEASVTIEELY
ncbi:hypothetical protein [Bacillus pumilus]|uniref:hypothetical protein n=1 Tax=Bacillus pumilus TaxID=1408 RepID=UPI002281E1B8|nr:hypothetical protein [Bacillus pumilus]MCY7500107.1 hypothetical protein [Bacillus pumilus]MCY7528569.1 hypothetical protein [Bacillus pumilus]MED4439471.1 hypothetical protein [Bacillus pumilus]MED4489914.1 hypothetical protein [Bacillus pumilus]